MFSANRLAREWRAERWFGRLLNSSALRRLRKIVFGESSGTSSLEVTQWMTMALKRTGACECGQMGKRAKGRKRKRKTEEKLEGMTNCLYYSK
jgi:hypothetical protein